MKVAGFAHLLFRAVRDSKTSRLETLATPKLKAEWLTRWSHEAIRKIELRIHLVGTPPQCGLIVANHVGYLDVLALASILPCAFICKADVREWPIFGDLVASCGTIFVNRSSKRDTIRANQLVAERLRMGIPVVLFPEGTSTDGSKVLPFHASLVQPAVDENVFVVPVAIRYLVNGIASTDVAFTGEAKFLTHLWTMLAVGTIDAYVTFGAAAKFTDRKIAASVSRHSVATLVGVQSEED